MSVPVGQRHDNANFRFARWLQAEMYKRRFETRHLVDLLDGEVPDYTVRRWLRGEHGPNGYQLAMLMERLQIFIPSEVLKPKNSDGAMVKKYPQTYFPGMGPRRKSA